MEEFGLFSNAICGLWKIKAGSIMELGKWWNHKSFLTNSSMPCHWILQDTAEKTHHVVSFKRVLALLGEPHEANECKEDRI